MGVIRTHKNGTAAAILQENARKKAIAAQKTANDAKEQAEAISNYFWHKNGTDAEAGAHVTEIPRKVFEANPAGGNILIQSQKVKFRMAMTLLNELDGDGMKVYESEDDENPVAQFLSSGAIIGKTTENHFRFNQDGLFGYKADADDAYMGIKPVDDSGYGMDISAADKDGFDEYTNYADLMMYASRNHGEMVLEVQATTDTEPQQVFGAKIDMSAYAMNLITRDETNHNDYIDLRTSHIKVNSKPPFATFTATGTVSLNHGTGGNVIVTGTVPDGYVPIAVQSIESEHNYTVLIGKFVLTATGADISLRNVASATDYTDMTVTATILCTALQ
jgi:hypothetical protein